MTPQSPAGVELDEVKQIVEEARVAFKAATEGPYFVGCDEAHDCEPHRESGLAMVDTGRESDWPIARLCEWKSARSIAAIHNAFPHLLAAYDERERLRAKSSDPAKWDFGHAMYLLYELAKLRPTVGAKEKARAYLRLHDWRNL